MSRQLVIMIPSGGSANSYIQIFFSDPLYK
jgi:hypothetical protein